MRGLAILSFVLLSSYLYPQSGADSEFKKIVENSFQEVMSDLDENEIRKYYTDDFVLFEGGEIFNLDSLRNYVVNSREMFSSEENKKHKFERINKFEFLKSGSEGGLGWIAYHNYAEFKMDGNTISKIHWLESATFVRTEDGWKISFLHSTPYKEENKQ